VSDLGQLCKIFAEIAPAAESFLFDTNRVSTLQNTGENYYDGG
jgi:hypothetical protein